MKTAVLSIRNILYAQGLELALKKTGNFRPIRTSQTAPSDIAAECMMRKTDILLMDVGPQETTTIDERMNTANEIRRLQGNIKVVFMCDEVAYPELAKQVMRTKQSGQIDAFYYTSVPAEYLVDALDAL